MPNHVLPPIGGGGGGRITFTPLESPFATVTDRDTWATANFNMLLNSNDQVTEVVADGDLFRWSGENEPASYNANQWLQISNMLDATEVKTLYESNSDTNAFTDSDDSSVESISNLTDGTLPVAGASGLENSMLMQMPDGTVATIGSLRAGTNTLELDLAHSISSSGENVTFRNEQSEINYHPVWQTYELGRDNIVARHRYQENTLQLVTDISTQITNPTWSVTVPAVDTEEGQTTRWAEIVVDPTSVLTNVELEIQIEGVVFTRFRNITLTPDPVTNVHRFTYQPNFDFNVGANLTFSLSSPDGDVVVLGNPANFPAITTRVALWNDEPIGLRSDDSDHPVTLRRDMPSEDDATALAAASLNGNSALWMVANNQIPASNRSDATIVAQIAGFLDLDGNEIPTTSVAANTIQLRTGTIVRIFSANDYRVVNSPVFEGDISGTALPIAASDVSLSNTDLTGSLADAGTVQEALKRIDNTGLGSQVREFDGSFFSTYFAGSANTNTWYGGRQTVSLRGTASTNGQYTFRIPSSSDITAMFNDLASRNLGEVYTLTIMYSGGSTGFVNRNRLTITNAAVSNGFPSGTFPTVLAQGQSATFRISRVGGVTSQWERIGFMQAVNPAPTLGEVVLQSTGWNNANNSTLPTNVLQGYAYPVIGSSPNDGTLRQGLLDSGVSDRIIYDGDYVVWTAATFTSWTNGDDWFVLPRNQLQTLSREESNFLAQTSEFDNRVDVGLVEAMANDALVWISENPLAAAPFLTPSTDPQNPRSGDSYPYIGGRENRNAQQIFQYSQNRFNSYLTLGITPSFISGHPESTIDIVVRDDQGDIIERLNLANDFTFRTDGDFTNGTVRHYTRSSTFNYPFLSTVAIVLTQVQDHYLLRPDTVNITQNIADRGITENLLSTDVVAKLNATPSSVNINNPIDPYLTRTVQITRSSDYGEAYFASSSATGSYPTQLSDFEQVSQSNPRYTATDVVLFVAVAEPDNYALMNTTQDTIVSLDSNSPNVDVVESFSENGVTYFVFRVTSVTSGNRFEILRVTTETLLAIENSINELNSDVAALEAEALKIPDDVRGMLENDITVTEETSPNLVPSSFNLSLGSGGTQKVFMEPSPNSPSGGALDSNVLSASPTARERRKLVYIGRDHVYQNSDLITGFDGVSNTRVLASYVQNTIVAKQFIPAVPAGSATSTIYPAPSNLVSGAGIWQTIEALTFRNGVPVPEADELFFTRNIPTTAQMLTIQYRGHANGNVFGSSSTTLANVGGSNEVATSVTIDDGSETATLEIRYYPNLNGSKAIRASVVERVNAGLPTINDVQVILSWEETRVVPATNSRTRDVEIERVASTGASNVIGVKPSSTGTIVLVGSEREVDTGFLFTDVFGATLGGHLTVFSDEGVFYDFQDLEPTNNTIVLLEQNSGNPNFNLFNTNYTHETIVDFDVQVQGRDSAGNTVKFGEELILVDTDDGKRFRITIDKGVLTPVQVV